VSGRAVAKGIWALLMIPGGIVLTLALMVATVALVLLVPPVAFALWADMAFPEEEPLSPRLDQEVTLDSPHSVPPGLKEFAARGYERVNRHTSIRES
jgi:hypothetical protein